MILLAQIALGLAALPAAMVVLNLFFYRRLPRPAGVTSPISVLIPARDEEAGIAQAIESVLANENATFEVVVLDDHSSDRTAGIVAAIANRDPRVRLEQAPALPVGWSGKQHACQILSGLARHDLLLFMDADVRLAPDGLARMGKFMSSHEAGLASGFPRQITGTIAEKLVVPIVHFLLLGYLPMFAMPLTHWPAFAAGCGQLMLVRRDAYERVGGHAAIATSLHDGLKLPRAFRAQRITTALFDATDVATCRMYRGAQQVWSGFAKNATEGMATPLALPVWTLLLLGGHVLPYLVLLLGVLVPLAPEALQIAGLAVVIGLATRLVLAVRFSQSPLGAALHPVGVVATLAIQVYARWRSRRGGAATWRGRAYPAQGGPAPANALTRPQAPPADPPSPPLRAGEGKSCPSGSAPSPVRSMGEGRGEGLSSESQ